MLGALINAGGESVRMGTHKALLPMPPDGTSLLAHTVAVAAAVVDGPIVVVANHAPVAEAAARLAGVMVVADAWPGKGPLAGIGIGLGLVPDWLLVLACDLPRLRVEVLRLLAGLCEPAWDVVMPMVDGRPQTLCAAYHRRCLPFVEAMLRQDRLRIRDLFGQVRVRYVEEDELRQADVTLQSFTNVNTPEEWQAIRALFDSMG
jgi:molybdopterin-guanine dinucleotide biosynthesis protein A